MEPRASRLALTFLARTVSRGVDLLPCRIPGVPGLAPTRAPIARAGERVIAEQSAVSERSLGAVPVRL